MSIKQVKVTHRHALASGKVSIKRLIHGIVEFITNVEDSYERKSGNSRKYNGKCTLRYKRGGKNNPSIIEVLDKAEGMDATKLESSMDIGEYNSDGSGRGFVGAGLKDPSAHGEIRIQTLKNKGYSEATFNLSKSLDLDMKFKDTKPNEQQLKDLGISKPSQTGTRITWIINPGTIKHTPFDDLINEIQNHFMLREILNKNSKTLTLNAINVNNGYEKVLEFKPPKVINNIFDLKIKNKEIDELNKYFGTNHDVRFVLNEIEESGQPLDEFARHGITIHGFKQVFELGFLNRNDQNTNSLLKRYSGFLKTELFDEALKEFRYTETPTNPEINPDRIFEPSRRQGIKYTHPLVSKIISEPRKKLDKFIKQLENTSNNKSISVNTKMLNKLQDFFAESMQDLDEVFSDKDRTNIETLTKDKYKVISFDLFPDEQKNVYVYTHIDTVENIKNKLIIKLNNEDQKYLKIINGLSKFEYDKQFEDRIRFKFKIEGIKPKNNITLNFHFEGKEHFLVKQVTINVKDYKNRIFFDDIEFGAKNYTLKKGSKRTIELYAKYPEISENTITAKLLLENPNDLKVNNQIITLERYKETNYLYGHINAEALSESGKSRLTAEINEKFASTMLTISNKNENPNHNFRFDVKDASFGEERYRWRENYLEIAGQHKSCKFIFENKKEMHSLGSSPKVHVKLFFAELFADAFAWKYMDTFIDKKKEELNSSMEDPTIATFEKYNMIRQMYYNQVFKLMFESNSEFLSIAS